MKNRKMRALIVVVTAALCLAGPRCTKNANPDTPPPPNGPAISKVGDSCAFKVTASDTDYDRVSARIDWNNGDTSDWSELFRSGETIALAYAWPAAGDFRISAQAKDEKGAVSLWSNWHAIVIADTFNLPPEVPAAPSGPDTGHAGATYEFTALASDPNGDRVYLQFDWGEGDASSWSALVSGGTLVTMSHVWDSAGDYSVRARAKDERNLVSDWSDVHILAVKDSIK